MEAKAMSKFVRISPRKTRLVVDLIRGKNAEESLSMLNVMNKKAAGIIAKTLKSAIANARIKELDVDTLWVKQANVDGGPVYKRFLSRAMGRATVIRRPTSHITLILSDIKAGSKEVVAKEEKPAKRRLFKRTAKAKDADAGTKKVKKQKTKVNPVKKKK